METDFIIHLLLGDALETASSPLEEDIVQRLITDRGQQ